MTEMLKNNDSKRLPPGVCIPWERAAAKFEPIAGNREMIKNEWEKLDAFAYVYLWWWVHR